MSNESVIEIFCKTYYSEEEECYTELQTEVYPGDFSELFFEKMKKCEKELKSDNRRSSASPLVQSVVKSIPILLKSEYFKQALRNEGYFNTSEISEEQRNFVEEQNLLKEDKILLVDSNNTIRYQANSSNDPYFSSNIRTIAQNKVEIYKRINPKFIFSEEDMKKLKKERRLFLEKEKDRLEKQRIKKEKEKQKEIERAKEILKKAGEKVPD